MDETPTPRNPNRHDTILTWANLVKGLFGAAAAVVGFFLVIVPIVGGDPDPTPTPRPVPTAIPVASSTAVPNEMGGTISSVELTHGVTWREYVATVDKPDRLAERSSPDEMGIMLTYAIELKGLVNQECEVRAVFVDTSTNQTIGGSVSEYWMAEAYVDRVTSMLWLPIGTLPLGEYYTWIVLTDSERVRLDTKQSVGFIRK